jgi:predicted lipoprotein
MLRVKSITLAPFLLAGILLASQALNAGTSDNPIRKQWHSGIAQGYQTLADTSDTLHDIAGDYCAAPGTAKKANLEESWKTAFLAWQRVRFVDFGPIRNRGMAWQFQFWPDPKNLVARKASYLLDNSQAITASVITMSGVAVQGFPLVEYLLYDTRFNSTDQALPADRTCALLTGVTGHIQANSHALLEDWIAFAPHYLENDEYTDTSIRAAMTALEILEQRRLGGPMGLRGTGKRSIYPADAWRSGHSLASMQATIEGLHDWFYPPFAALLGTENETDLAKRIDTRFRDSLAQLESLNRPLGPLLANDDEFAQLQSVYVTLSQLTQLVNGEAAQTLGVVRGFNSSDGD